MGVVKVTVDLPPAMVWQIIDRAEKEHTTPGVILRRELAGTDMPATFDTRVRARVLAGMCDADIGIELGRTVTEIARIRRSQGLPANHRYRKTNTRKAP